MELNAAPAARLRLSRRRLLLLAGAAGTGLLAASQAAYAFETAADRRQTVAGAVVATAATRASAAPTKPPAPRRSLLEQAGQSGFTPIASSLTFGAPTDLAAGWDGTVWAIDSAGAPHLYDPVADQWELFGTGVDAAALIDDGEASGPAVYFRGPEVYVANSSQVRTIPQVWPNLPASYKLGVHGAAWANGQLYLFRGGTYLGVPWAPPVGAAQPGATPPSPTTTGTPHAAAGTPGAATATPTAAPHRRDGTPAPAPTERVADQPLVFGALVHAAGAGVALSTAGASAAQDPTATAGVGVATATATATPSTAQSPTATPVQTARSTPTFTPTPAPSATATVTPVPSTTATSTPGTTTTATPEPSVTPTATATPAASPTATPAPAAEVGGALSPLPLSSLPGWPPGGGWADGVIDSVYSASGGVVLLIRGGQFVTLTFQGPTPSVSGPQPLAQHAAFQTLPPEWLQDGFDGGFHCVGGPWAGWNFAFKGPQALLSPSGVGAATPAAGQKPKPGTAPPRGLQGPHEVGAEPRLYYIPAVGTPWPASWNPVLQQAPTGRSGGLWAATTASDVVSHDGSRWTVQPGNATCVAAGADGSVFAVPQENATQLQQWTGAGWKQVAQAGSALSQVTVGDSGHVWVRDSANAVHQLTQQQQLQRVPLLGTTSDLAANFDGTVWTCNGSDAQAFRFLPTLGTAPDAIAAQGSVHKVASTGFGMAHCLVQQGGSTQVYRYQSPFLFKTTQDYPIGNRVSGATRQLTQGLGNVYCTIGFGDNDTTNTYYVVAVDAHTGLEVSRSAPAANMGYYSDPVFDPVHEVVLVVQTPFRLTPGPPELVALDAHDLTKVLWTLSQPVYDLALSGTQLCAVLGGNQSAIAMFDTGTSRTSPPTFKWSYAIPAQPYGNAWYTPVIANGKVYAAAWQNSQQQQSQLVFVQGNALDGSGFTLTPLTSANSMSAAPGGAPVLATVVIDGTPRRCVFINGITAVWRVDLDAPQSPVSFPVSIPNVWWPIGTGLAYANGVLWFGDSLARLWGVDAAQMKPIANTPVALVAGGGGGGATPTIPLIASDAQGTQAVIVSSANLSDASGSPVPNALLLVDPTSGNVGSIPTGNIHLTSLGGVADGVVYGAGVGPQDEPTSMFSIRVDRTVQDLRDVIVESQLMQDFDGQSTPSGVARYQTNVTLVDNNKAPLARESVKIWADKPSTVRINGSTYSIGPADTQYAAVQTAADGTLTIVSGSVANDGTDKPDMSAVPLRLSAAFMDPYERILVAPDREFHNRLATAHATNANQPGADDPTRVNLQTTQKYGPLQKGGANSGAALFTDQQKQQDQPKQVASAIQTFTGSVGVASGGKQATWSLRATSGASKYIPYSDLLGSQYSPVNTAAVRSVTVTQPAGLSYSRDSAGSQLPSFSTHSPAEATLAIDALDGQDWHTSQYATPRVLAAARSGTLNLGSWWGDFWGWVKQAAATITHVIVSVAEDIYAGIRFIVDGVAHVFRAIINGIEDAVSAIGAFFIELGHLIEEVIQALSVLFHFEEIIKTHDILKDQLLKVIRGVPGSPTYIGFSTAVSTYALPRVNAFFNRGEQAINSDFTSFTNKVAAQNPPMTRLKGQGGTPHTAFTVPPKNGGQPSSHAVQSTWGIQKLQGGLGSSSSASSSAAVGQASPAATQLAQIFEQFATNVGDNGPLQADWQQVKQGAQNLGASSSLSDFVSKGVAELLNVLALVLNGVLAVSQAFLDAVLRAIEAVLTVLLGQDVCAGLVTATVDIPVLSWLYQTLFGEPLTFLNALALVAAIPITILWRVVEGVWPSQSFSAEATSQLADAPPLVGQLLALFGGIVVLVGSVVSSIVDGVLEGHSMAAGGVPGGVYVLANQLLLVCLLVTAASNFPLNTTSHVDDLTWAYWSALLGVGILGIFGLIPLVPGGTAEKVVGPLLSVLTALLSIMEVIILSLQFAQNPPAVWQDDFAFGVNISSTLPGIVNPLKFLGEEWAAGVALLDLFLGGIVGVMLIGRAIADLAGGVSLSIDPGAPRAPAMAS